MMQYKYRWVYAIFLSLIVLLTGYFYDLKEKWAHLMELEKNEESFTGRGIAKKPVEEKDSNNKQAPAFSPLKKMNSYPSQI